MNYNKGHAESMMNLRSSEGWFIIEAWLGGRIIYHKAQLLTCDLDKVELHRAQIKTFEAVLLKPQQIIDEVAEYTVDQHFS